MKGFIGEFIGTFILVFIGCGSVGWSILIEPLALWQIALIWGVGVALAIMASCEFSKSHLNPAVTIGFMLNKDFSKKRLISYLVGQFMGAFMAALALYLLMESSILEKSIDTARMFGEYYASPEKSDKENLSMFTAFIVEGLGTFLLMFGIFRIVALKLKKGKFLNPLLIGALLAILIFLLAPYTQAGFNPARDFMPRLFSYLNGWEMAFWHDGMGWLTVYIIAPLFGASIAAILNHKLFSKKN